MPPKRRGAARYKDAMSYYKAAYRAHLKENADWNTNQIASTLAWMWMHASEGEKQNSRDLLASKAQTLPVVNANTIPAGHRTKDNSAPAPIAAPAPAPAPALAPAPAEVEGFDDGGGIDDDDDHEEPSAKRARVNTTTFSYWPDPKPLGDPLPADQLLHRDKKEKEKQWRFVHILGAGTAVQVGLWIKTNSNSTIIDVNSGEFSSVVVPKLICLNSALQLKTPLLSISRTG
jgi:hypothetical protein